MAVAVTGLKGRSKYRGKSEMRELADEFMKLLAVIMILITVAVSTAAVASMFG